MICIQECKGVPIISLNTGERLGFISNAIYEEQKKVKGFIIEGNANISFKIRKKCIFLEDVLRLNKEMCMIYSENNIRTFKNKKGITDKCSLEEEIGKSVVSEAGDEIGVVNDMFFDIATGNLEGLEISKGFMNDVIEGKNKIFINDGVEFAEEFIIAKGDIY